MADPDSDEHESIAPPRPGAHCANHPQRTAVVRCTTCDRDVCFSCFLPDLARCQRCVELHPEEVAEPIPFESVGMVRGFAASVAMAFAPNRTAPAFAIGDSLVRPAIFFLLTFVPLAVVRGILPYTHHVHFGPLGLVAVDRGTSSHALLVDVVRAMGLSFAECALQLVVFTASYVSLAGAFGRGEARVIGLRTIAYRAFLLPLGGSLGVLSSLLAWLGPEAFSKLDAVFFVGLLPLVPFYMAAHRTVRAVGRVDLFPGVGVVGVPLALGWMTSDLTLLALLRFLPPEFRGE